MTETFLCFEVESSLFLIPLSEVFHIVPGVCDGEGKIAFRGQKIESYDLYALMTGTGPGERSYAVLMQTGGQYSGLYADQIAGVYELPDRMKFAVPKEVCGEKNGFLKEAAYVEVLKSWAFLIDTELLMEKERY